MIVFMDEYCTVGHGQHLHCLSVAFGITKGVIFFCVRSAFMSQLFAICVTGLWLLEGVRQFASCQVGPTSPTPFLCLITLCVGRGSLPHGIPETGYNPGGAAQDFPAFSFPPNGYQPLL